MGNPGALSGVTSIGQWGEARRLGGRLGSWGVTAGPLLRGIRANVMGKAQPKAAEAMTAVATAKPMTMPVTVSDVAFAEA